ncbi:MAG: hydroxymethylpyrimidine/phosphomethylpyrimidine kinase [Mesorhizobium sp.]|nr:hydroxymethylpyrimidine/phosphomethylpyrimidine kinase [Mesorhizobium sp.]RWJ39764.1 MAG: hydroxymethylpyrimidine/phosphomethylpyrimidine kinase [Mesorhizobium sp.]RWJ81463.1 MAG: hydroxymethylpyrimidine/phosphomethylpyrimidine kinase [Mesorhizobium sp.]TIR08925.1 MAG: hydroxymethylpyrimidine/phosphomethylpyrimidine kinase [Mesorhizobium sp.]
MAIDRESCVLVVAGTDSSGGAGVTRDVETIAALGLSSCVAVTAVTAQTHRSVDWIEHTPPRFIAAQMRAAIAANNVKAIKIGMLGTDGAIQEAAKVLRDHSDIPVVLDPVLAASSGRALIVEDAVAALRRDLMPLCRLVTPNMPELAVLTGSASPSDEASACRRGEELVRTVGTAVLVKGGHASGSESVDLLLQPHLPALRYASPRLPREMRGTGCMLSSAIAVSLALGASLEQSVRRARQYVFDALAGSK